MSFVSRAARAPTRDARLARSTAPSPSLSEPPPKLPTIHGMSITSEALPTWCVANKYKYKL